jgi:Tol biopolymer transport system component
MAWGLAGTIDVVFDGSQFGTIDSASGAYTQISNIPVSEAAGAASVLNMLYVEDIYSNLLSIDPNTGIATLIGNSGMNLTATVFGGGVNGLFELDPSSNLYSVSAATGQATLIGQTGLPTNNFSYDTSLSSDGSYLYYTAGPAGGLDELYRIDTTTGATTDLGTTGVKSIAGSAFVDGQLDLFQYGQSTNYIYSAPDGSTQFTQGPVLGAQIIDGGAVIADAATLDVPANGTAPEPGSFALAISGSALALGLARRRRSRRAVPRT